MLDVPASRFDVSYRLTQEPVMEFHAHLAHEIYYFHEGKCNYVIGGQMYVLEPGDLILMNGLTLHRPKTFPGEPYVRSVIHFDSGYFANVLQRLGMAELLEPFDSLRSVRLRLDETRRAQFERMLRRMQEFRDEGTAAAGYRLTFAFLDALACIRAWSSESLREQPPAKMDKERQAQRVVEYIERHYMQDLSLDRMERELHLSRYYLAKLFKEVTGATIFAYLYHRRIHQAKIEWLLAPELSVTELSYQVGFKHPAHFSRVFKQLAGMTPEQYRRHHRSRLNDMEGALR